jgi:hypothetical protein
MSIFGSVQITGFIAPTYSGDTYATHDAYFGRDGLRNVDVESELDGITDLRRRAGMIVGVSGGTAHYRLLPAPWSFTFNDWTLAFLTPQQTNNLIISGVSSNETFVYFSASTVGQSIFNSVLSTVPTDVTKTKFYVNGVKYRYGNVNDYQITGGTSVIWTGPFNLDTFDDLTMIYF